MRLAHVDGLRAVAVLAVLFFHVGAKSFSGGFVGVDIFFVISGFVITRQIVRDMDQGKFTLVRFYERRLKRLYPALILTIVACFAAAFLILPPSLLSDFSRSAIASLTAWSNIYFWNSAGYFDTASDLKPLLHTWTLSLEWQFYLVWPLLLSLIPRRFLPHAIIILSAASAVASSTWRLDPVTPFYWMQFRIFEFGLGALVLWMPEPRRSVGDLTVAAGLALIAYAVFSFTDQTPFPSHFALIPALGAAMIIWGGKAGILSGTLRLAPITYLGRISYSTYLVHWPLIVFTICYTAQDLEIAAATAICVLSVVLGSMVYHAVEYPFWRGRFAPRAKFAVAISAIPALAVLFFSTGGLWWRLPPPWNIPAGDSSQFHHTHYGGAGYETNRIIRVGSADSPVLFHIMGDSFAMQLLTGLDAELKSRGLAADVLGDWGCPMMVGTSRLVHGKEDEACSAARDSALNTFSDGRPILFSISWYTYSTALLADGKPANFDDQEQYLDFIVDRLAATAKATNSSAFIIIGDLPSLRRMRLSPMDCATSPEYLGSPKCKKLMNARLPNTDLSRRLSNLTQAERVHVIEPSQYLCGGADCHAFDGSELIYSDAIHLSKHGSRMIAKSLLNDILAIIGGAPALFNVVEKE